MPMTSMNTISSRKRASIGTANMVAIARGSDVRDMGVAMGELPSSKGAGIVSLPMCRIMRRSSSLVIAAMLEAVMCMSRKRT